LEKLFSVLILRWMVNPILQAGLAVQARSAGGSESIKRKHIIAQFRHVAHLAAS
jgi:hypothetical protein